MMFTPEELAEMARFDAEIEAEFDGTLPSEERLSRQLDREAEIQREGKRVRPKTAKDREKSRMKYARNRERVLARQKMYREENRDHIRRVKSEWYQNNRKKVLLHQSETRSNNRWIYGEDSARLKRARINRGLSCEATSKMLGVAKNTLSAWENGRQPMPWDRVAAVFPEIGEKPADWPR